MPNWRQSLFAGVGFAVTYLALQPEVLATPGARLRLILLLTLYWGLFSFLLDRYLYPRMMRLFERRAEMKREREEREREVGSA